MAIKAPASRRASMDLCMGTQRGDSAAAPLSESLVPVRPPCARLQTVVAMSEFTIQALLETATVSVRDIYCRGSCRAATPEESTQGSHLVFPYRGVFVRHVGCTAAVAEAN